MPRFARIALAVAVTAGALLVPAAPAGAAVCEGLVDTTCADGSRLCVAWAAGRCVVPYQTETGGIR